LPAPTPEGTRGVARNNHANRLHGTTPARRRPGPFLADAYKRGSRVAHWRQATADAEAALTELRDLQQEYEDWAYNLPEFAQSTALEEKPEAMQQYDIESLIEAAAELAGADLPLGFGRD
jgi:hypothetical protein